MNNAITMNVGADGIAVATMDLPGRPMNVVNDELMTALAQVVERVAGDETIRGLVLASAKADFCAGGDIDRMSKWQDPREPFDASMAMKAVLRRMETMGKPVVAAIGGHALGGGLEIALACHARVVLDDRRLKLGQPEVKLGLLPGGGGTVRLPRLVGIQAALQIMAEGNDVAPAKALGMGLVTELATDRDDLLARARAWCVANPKARQPWDQPKFRFPGGDSRAPAVAQMWSIAPSVAAAKSYGNYPAITHIMSSVFEGGLLGFDAASVVESRYFAACATSQASRNMIGTLWYQLNAIKKGASRPPKVPPSKVTKLGVLGAGMMGAGIAYVSARAGIDGGGDRSNLGLTANLLGPERLRTDLDQMRSVAFQRNGSNCFGAVRSRHANLPTVVGDVGGICDNAYAQASRKSGEHVTRAKRAREKDQIRRLRLD